MLWLASAVGAAPSGGETIGRGGALRPKPVVREPNGMETNWEVSVKYIAIHVRSSYDENHEKPWALHIEAPGFMPATTVRFATQKGYESGLVELDDITDAKIEVSDN